MQVRHLNKNSGIFQSSVSIVGNILATGMSAIALILITRILGPEKFGVFSVGFSIVMILTKINELGLNTPIIKFGSSADSKDEKNLIYSLTLKYKLIFSLVTAVLGLIGANFIAEVLNFPEPTIIALAFTIGLVTTYYEHLLSILQSLHLFTNTVVINALQAGSKLILSLILLFSGLGQVWLVFTAYIISPLTPLFFSKKLLPSWVKTDLKAVNKTVQNRLFMLGKHSAVALISAGIIENVDVLFLQKNLTTYETGLYGGVLRVAMVFALVAYSLANVLNARVAKYKSREHLRSYIQKALGVAALAAMGFAAFVPLARLVILLTIGPEYIAGVGVMLILTAASFLAIASIPFIALFYSLEANWYFSVSGILQLIIVLVGNAVFVPIYGLEAAAWTRFATRMFLFLFTVAVGLYLYRKHYGANTQKTFQHT